MWNRKGREIVYRYYIHTSFKIVRAVLPPPLTLSAFRLPHDAVARCAKIGSYEGKLRLIIAMKAQRKSISISLLFL